MSDQPTPAETALWRRRLAAEANNRAWSLAESLSRSADEDEEMLQAAHAAMYLWKTVGDETNRAHAALLVAHVYALLKQAGPAARYLAQAQPVVLSDRAEPWELALAHAVMANVAAAGGDETAQREHYQTAAERIAALPDPEDRAILEATLKVVPAPA